MQRRSLKYMIKTQAIKHPNSVQTMRQHNIVNIDKFIDELNKAKCDVWYSDDNGKESSESEEIIYGHTIERVCRIMLHCLIKIDSFVRESPEEIAKIFATLREKALEGINQ